MTKRTRLRLAALAIAMLTALPLSPALAEGYTPYPAPKTAISEDGTIYLRAAPTGDTEEAAKLKHMEGKPVKVLGEDRSGKYLYIEYDGRQGFVRAKDFELTDKAAPTPTPTPFAGGPNVSYYYGAAKTGTARDSAIYMRTSPEIPAPPADTDSNVARKIKKAKGASFALLGESGDWYYAEYGGVKGFVKKADFALQDAAAPTPTPAAGSSGSGKLNRGTSGSTEVGHGAASEKWGRIKIPGSGTYTIYGNYTNSAGTKYYYAAENLKGHYEYVHTLTAKGSQVHSILGHNVRGKGKYFHKLHHVQNALIGKGRCEGCGGSCGGSRTTKITMELDGYKTWDIMCLYEIGPNQSTGILAYNARPWGTSASSYVSTQLSYAADKANKGWVNPNVSFSDGGKYAMLITCGDKFESSSNATSKLYVLLKARD